ncbi:NADH dehydrogenase subunit D [Motilibacter rhizosphaerae]|uniref:NADH dehydrogenase subunit D n=1 Tax=Motilibacter rhizosphaerae TaxID=598652 RepID=A0A4Q7NB93_9ACTN|nr:NADH-quinone oxidoreductase subunit D [Motilibacter rhizosphaerae]RZS79439.1 NADH dehydrogenase subunit D [Motilibacter rhizosphaerae]
MESSRGTGSLVAGVGASTGWGEGAADLVLPIGPQHPSAHGGIRLRLALEDGVVRSVEPEVGFMHRGAEKLFEVRDYRQILVLANRHDWLSAFGNELGIVLATELLLGMAVPPRATWARTCLAEIGRTLASLAFLASPPDPHGEGTVTHQEVLALREPLQRVLEEVSGGRVHFMLNRVGGLKEDVPAGWPERAAAAVAEVRAGLPRVRALTVGDPALAARLRGIGVLPREAALGWGASGPVARGSGVGVDLRRDAPYLSYGALDVPRVVRAEGDALARWEVLLESATDALALAEACLPALEASTGEEHAVRLPKVLTVPVGTAYAATENPLGLNGYYLVSRGGKVPWRLKLRSASFGNVQAVQALLPGTRVEDLAAVVTSLFFVTGDVDR